MCGEFTALAMRSAVLFGGISEERDVSVSSGAQVVLDTVADLTAYLLGDTAT